MITQRRGLSKVVGAIFIIVIILLILVLGLISYSNDNFRDLNDIENIGERNGDNYLNEDSSLETPVIVWELNGTIYDVYKNNGKIYILAVEDTPNMVRRDVYMYVFDLDSYELLDKILVYQEIIGATPKFKFLTIKDDYVYLYNTIENKSYNITIFSVSDGEIRGSYLLEGVSPIAIVSNYIYLYRIESENVLVLEEYNLDSGNLTLEIRKELPGIDRLDEVFNVFISLRGDTLYSIVVGYEADFEFSRFRIYHIILKYSVVSKSLDIEVFPSKTYGAYGSLLTATGYIVNDSYFIFHAFSLSKDGDTFYGYLVERRTLDGGSLLWSYEEDIVLGMRNRSAYISSYVDSNGIFYVSWVFIGGFKDGDKIFSRSPWGGIYVTSTPFIVVTATVSEGGINFLELDGDIYIPWVKRVKGSGIKELILYQVDNESLREVYDLYDMGYRGLAFFVYESNLYLVGSYKGMTSVIVKLI